MSQGTVFSIEEFAINDGPGIRTTVFLKGCPLRCAWCHNPEGLSPLPQMMHKKDGDEVCGKLMSAEELSSKLLKDRKFFEMNEGGVTFTGGEPTAQSEFLIDVLDRVSSLHRAIETSGYCKPDIFREVASRTEYVLFDVKHADPAEHRRWTGVDNAPILENLEWLCGSGKQFVVRIPLIPGVNDTMENMNATLELIRNAKNLFRVELLRYHKTAGAKYAMVDRVYDPPFDTEAVPRVFNVFKKNNIDTIIL